MAHQTIIVTRTQRDSSAGSPFPCQPEAQKSLVSDPRSLPECNTSERATPQSGHGHNSHVPMLVV
eukprot:1001361-Prymnesium_polylepis.1